jgi:hypothetical protein
MRKQGGAQRERNEGHGLVRKGTQTEDEDENETDQRFVFNLWTFTEFQTVL